MLEGSFPSKAWLAFVIIIIVIVIDFLKVTKFPRGKEKLSAVSICVSPMTRDIKLFYVFIAIRTSSDKSFRFSCTFFDWVCYFEDLIFWGCLDILDTSLSLEKYLAKFISYVTVYIYSVISFAVQKFIIW